MLVGVVSMRSRSRSAPSATSSARAITGVDTSWDISLGNAATIFLANVLGMLIGFTLGVLIRNSAGAIVGYFVYALVLPALFETAGRRTRTGSTTCAAGSTSTSPQRALYDGGAERDRVGPRSGPPASSGWSSRSRSASALVLRSEVK